MTTQNQKGFTLVEIAIVLVIIGLLLGGVMKGQEIIENAKFKNAASQTNAIIASAFAYQDRYRKLPGDGSAVGVTPTAASNGRIEGDESAAFFVRLVEEGFLASTPTSPWGNTLVVRWETPVFAPDTNAVCFVGLPEGVAIVLDIQNDDGDLTTGSVRGAPGTGVASNGRACFGF